jgi:outer membrane protein OmpA-like peptidoglycan-associated protein
MIFDGRSRPARGGVLLGVLLALCPVAARAAGSGEAQGKSSAGGRETGLELTLDPDDVELARGRLTLRLSRPAAKVTLKILDSSGGVLAVVEQAFEAAPAGSPLVVSWSTESAPAEAVARIEVFGHDTSGYFKGIAITPWSFSIPHEDVVFDTDSAEIRPSEAHKLKASLALIQKELPKAKAVGAVSLFVLAHTDSVGAADYNERLSTRRAQSIAAWFRRAGLRIPIAYDGVGERALAVKTADEVDEPRNRRADYMLAVEPPRFKGSGAAPAWKRF